MSCSNEDHRSNGTQDIAFYTLSSPLARLLTSRPPPQVCTAPPANSSDGMNGCGPRPSPWRWLSLEATPATLGLYAVLALATLAPREWVPY